MASLGQMIGGIAHNLKTPIMSISGAAEGILDLVNEYRAQNPESTEPETVPYDEAMQLLNPTVANATNDMLASQAAAEPATVYDLRDHRRSPLRHGM